MISQEEILEMVRNKTGVEDLRPDTDIFGELGCCGDDFDELMQEYAGKFKVDLKGYIWYFHSDEEGQNFGGNFFNAPYERVKRIPVTPALLFEFASKGVWDLNYPPHKMPKYRVDIWINYLLIAIVLFLIIRYCKN